MLLFITTCTDVYLFVLCSSLRNYFLSHFVPALYSTIGSCCIPALLVVLLPCNGAGLWLSPFCCLVLDYLFINHTLHFLSFSFLPFFSCDCSPMSHYNTDKILFITEHLSPKWHWQSHSPPPQTLVSTLLADTTLLRLYTAHTLPCINSVLEQQAFF